MQATIISRTVITLTLLLFGQASWSATVLVAVAANFSKPMTEIVSQFEKATGHSVKLSFGSSGKFVSQLENGGPFEVLLSADEKGPEKLEQAGLTVPNTRFVYALGKLVLWSSKPNFVDDKGKILMTSNFKHLALADPKVAPYGAAAIDVLKKMKLLEKLQPLFVQGENIAQTYQFISTANAELGFLALSQVIENGKIVGGSSWIIPDNLHAPIRQGAVLMKKGAENPAARALIDYLKSIPALAIIKKYGYDLAK
jgi:molybdate transport system substrate-binding protein